MARGLHDCTKCFQNIPSGEAVECFGTVYHKQCAPRNVHVKPVFEGSFGESSGNCEPTPRRYAIAQKVMERAVADNLGMSVREFRDHQTVLHVMES